MKFTFHRLPPMDGVQCDTTLELSHLEAPSDSRDKYEKGSLVASEIPVSPLYIGRPRQEGAASISCRWTPTAAPLPAPVAVCSLALVLYTWFPRSQMH
ncbi:hypothetical protein I7I48_04115 [Histoplasma ohiense]|nr:hypothetical protein I7I48_04115 [Histoplasma ohiense (nom. inval.)]